MRFRAAIVLILLLAIPAAEVFAQRRAPRQKAGQDATRLERIRVRMREFVDAGRASGIVTLVGYKGAIADLSAVGLRDLETKKPMEPDTIFQIASMTKPVTALGIMILMEEGRLTPADPVRKYLPKFAAQKLQVRAAESDQTGELSEIRSPSRAITIGDLLTHTSGMGGGYPKGFEDLFNRRDRTLAEAVDAFPERHLEFEPGSRWGYSNMGIATLGRIIEVVSGQPFDDFIAERVFKPLGMKDTHFFVPVEKRDRIATIYRFDGEKLSKADVDLYREGAKYPAPEGGLYSTAGDLFRLYQMMLNGGELEGRRIISRATVDLMTRNHTGDLRAGFSPGMGYGYGWSVIRDASGMFRLQSIGTFGHGGLWKTWGYADPSKGLVGIILMQRLSDDGDLSDEFNAFATLAGAAVE